jgi:hypothetical protein
MAIKYQKIEETASEAASKEKVITPPATQETKPEKRPRVRGKGKGFASWPKDELIELSRRAGAIATPETRTYSVNRKLASAAAKMKAKRNANRTEQA